MTPTLNARYRSLDAWRGLACLMVVVVHSVSHAGDGPGAPAMAVVARMWAGVPIFFVISGFCIAATADAHRRKGLGIATYFVRRVRRIYPPYLLYLGIDAVAVGVLDLARPGLFTGGELSSGRPWWLDGWNWLGTITLTEGWRRFVVGSDTISWFSGQAWTLGYEEQFYAVTGVILILAPRRFFAAVTAVTAAVIAFYPWRSSARGTFLDGAWLQFAAGILVYWAVNHAPRRLRVATAAPLVAGILLALCDPGVASATANMGNRNLVAFGFAILLLAAHPFDAAVAAHPLVAPLSRCGVMSYSLYLVHWPIAKAISHLMADAGVTTPAATLLLTVPACVAASVLAGRLFYRGVERRFLNTPQPEVHGRSRVACVADRQEVAHEAMA